MTDDVAEASPRPDAPPPRNKGGRPKSDTITLTKQARDRFNRKVVQNIDTLFDALFDAATKDGDVNAARLLIDRAIPSRRGAPIHFPLRPLKTAQDCADVLTDLLSSVAEGQLTPDEASQLSGIVSKRAESIRHHRAGERDRCPQGAARCGRRHSTCADANPPPVRNRLIANALPKRADELLPTGPRRPSPGVVRKEHPSLPPLMVAISANGVKMRITSEHLLLGVLWLAMALFVIAAIHQWG